jgi:hypothetical protein
MKFKIISEEEANPCNRDKLEEAVNDAANFAYMLSCTIEERVGQDDEKRHEQNEAIAYGVYRLQDLVKETKDIYYAMCDELRQVRVARGEIVDVDGENEVQNVVSLH